MRWLPWIVLGLGILLRIVQCAVTPPERYYDDHLKPIQIILKDHRTPEPEECWSCYHPPLFYRASAQIYLATQQICLKLGFNPREKKDAEAVAYIGLQAIHFGCAVAGCIALIYSFLILRRTGPWPPLVEAVALGFLAFLPAHIHMSAMITNDSYTYALASVALYAFVRSQQAGWPIIGCIITGALIGAAVITKIYALVTAVTLIGGVSVWALYGRQAQKSDEVPPAKVGKAATTESARKTPPSPWPRVGILVAAFLAVGIWPTLRTVQKYGKLHVDNYELFKTSQQNQPPGEIGKVSFLSFRFLTLMEHPWMHLSTQDSFFTQIYARLWFEYEGFNNSLHLYEPWRTRRTNIAHTHNFQKDPNFYPVFLNYDESVTPPVFRNVGRVAYVIGIPLTAALLAGFIYSIRRWRARPEIGVLALHAVFAFGIPLVQTVRLPTFSAMKSEFALLGCAAWPLLVACLLTELRPASAKLITRGLGALLLMLLGLDLISARQERLEVIDYNRPAPTDSAPSN